MDSRVDSTERDTDGGDDVTKGQVGVAGNRPTRRVRPDLMIPRARYFLANWSGESSDSETAIAHALEDSAMPWLPQVVKGLEPVESR